MLIIDRFLSQLASINSFHWEAWDNWWINKLLNCCSWAQCALIVYVMAPPFMSTAELLSALLQRVLLVQCAAALLKSTQKLAEAFLESLFKSLFHPEIVICTLIRLNPSEVFWTFTFTYQIFVATCCLLTYFCQWWISCPWYHWHNFLCPGKHLMEGIFQFSTVNKEAKVGMKAVKKLPENSQLCHTSYQQLLSETGLKFYSLILISQTYSLTELCLN